MAGNRKPKPADEFAALFADVKGRIQSAQTRAMLAVNAELVRLYWDIGRLIHAHQQQEGWGAKFIPRLSAGLKNDLPDVKGFSERNIKLMLQFYQEYPDPSAIVPQAAAQLPPPTGQSASPAIVQPAVAQLPAAETRSGRCRRRWPPPCPPSNRSRRS